MKSEEISTFLQQKIDAKDFPSAVYLVAEKGEVVFQDALGFAVVEPEKIEATNETIYDLASLTKPLVTGLLCVKLIEQGKIKLEDKISKFFGEFDTNDKREITIENLLTHTSGFRAWLPFYLITNYELRITSIIASEGLENPTNAKVVYSDFNFLLLGFLIKKFYGKSLDKIARQEIFEPLNLQDTFYNPPRESQKRIVASERGNEYEKQMCREMFPEIRIPHSAFRNRLIWGEVHDGNCFFMNGFSGHAGLFFKYV